MCPLCGAEQRLGVWLPRFKARLFDLVKSRGTEGIRTEEIIYDHALLERAHPKARMRGYINAETIRNHFSQINDMLAGTDYAILGEPGCHDSHWRLTRRTQRGYQCRSIKSSSPTLSAKAHSIFS